jgi:hypothetical protein
MIFHSYVYVYQRVINPGPGKSLFVIGSSYFFISSIPTSVIRKQRVDEHIPRCVKATNDMSKPVAGENFKVVN